VEEGTRIFLAPILRTVDTHIDAAGGGYQHEVRHQVRVSQCQLQGNVRAHRLGYDDSGWSSDGPRDVIDQIVVAAHIRRRGYESESGQINGLNVP